MNSYKWLLLILIAGSFNLRAQTWNLVFQEDFNGSSVNTANWSMYDGPGHAGNGLRKPSAFSVSGGLLTVTAQMINGTLVSGGMAHRSNYRYGKFEFRVRTEPDPSQAMSGVVLTWPQSENWPIDGENDIYETGTAASRNPYHTFIHYGANNSQYHFQHNADGSQWHTMAMEWDASAIRIYRDGALVWTLTDANAIPDVAHHLCIQLDAFRTSMSGTVRMYVDWVKIYQAAPGGPVANGTYKIIARHSGKCVDAYGTANGSDVRQWSYGGGANQKWTLTHLGNSQYKIINFQSGRSLDVANNSTADGANIQVWDYAGTGNQKWTITATSGGYYRVTAVHSGKAMDVSGASTANDADIFQWTYGGGNNQQWAFQAP